MPGCKPWCCRRVCTPLQGWKLHALSFGSVIFGAAGENSAITWGNGTCGELGYGPAGKKSAANPDKV